MARVPPSKEQAFESLIEGHLLAHGWERGGPSGFDPQLGLDTDEVFAFIGATQAEAWEALVERKGGDGAKARSDFRRLLAKRIDEVGVLQVLRRGITDTGVDLRLAYFKPAHGVTPELVALHQENRCTVVRQLPYSVKEPRDTLDLALLLNGVPVASAELKNPLTGQDYRDAIRQYRQDRDPHQPFFAGRVLVNFAVDPDRVYLSTRLAGKDTRFLPFNQGSAGAGRAGGAGNPPPHDGRHATAYLWEQVWEREAWLELLSRFVHLQGAPAGRDRSSRRKAEAELIFPRFHQWDAVRKLTARARERGPGENALVQHSAGSGKSNTIAWLSHHLSNLHDTDDRKVFDKVVVVTDRVVLDRQLQSTIFQFDHEPGVVEKVETGSAALAAALESSVAKIVITTLQKFPFVLEKVGDLSGRRFAVIVDEAHSSQSGEAAKALKAALGSPGDDGDEEEQIEPDQVQDLVMLSIQRSAEERGRQPNLSFFAFTATPTQRTLSLFGERDGDGELVPFHVYSMQQAIEEEFILDVLRHYVSYGVFWKIASEAADDPEVERGEATAAVVRFVSAHPSTVAEKAKIIAEHFHATTSREIGGRAKAMVVTASREQAVRTYQAIVGYAAEKGYASCRAAVAFSGSIDIDGETFTEAGINGFGEEELARRFAGEEFRLLVVAEKYQTGFDQPLLHTMYVDKELGGLRAVQTLSRLNRVHPAKEGAFVLDFVNSAADVQAAFAPFYEATSAIATDPNELYAAHAAIFDFEVVVSDDETAFALAFLEGHSDAHAALYEHLAPARRRYEELESDAERKEFRAILAKFCDLYSFLSQAIAFYDVRLERSYIYGRHLLRLLPGERGERLDISGDLQLTHLRFQAGKEVDASLDEGGEPLAAEEALAGLAPEPARDLLSEVIRDLNERHGLQLGAGDEVIHRIIDSLVGNTELREAAANNPFSSFALLFDQRFEEKAVEARSQSSEFFERTFGDPTLREELSQGIGREVYRRLREQRADG